MKKKRDRKSCTIHMRVPCWLKKKAVAEAKKRQVSLSRFVTARIAFYFETT